MISTSSVSRPVPAGVGRAPEFAGFLISVLVSGGLLYWIWTLMPDGLGSGNDGRLISGIAKMIRQNGIFWDPVNISTSQGAYNITYPFGLMFTSTWPYALFEHETARFLASAISVAAYSLAIVALGRTIGLSWTAMPIVIAFPSALQIYPFDFEYGASALFHIVPGAFIVIALFTLVLVLLIRCTDRWPSLLRTYLLIGLLAVWSIAGEPLWAGLFAIGFAPLGVAVVVGKGRNVALHGLLLVGLAGLLWVLGPLEYLYLTLVANARTMLNDEMGRQVGMAYGVSAILYSREALLLHVVTLAGLLSGCLLKGGERKLYALLLLVLLMFYLVAIYYLIFAERWPLPLPVYLETGIFHVLSTFALAALARNAKTATAQLSHNFPDVAGRLQWLTITIGLAIVPASLLAYGSLRAPDHRDAFKVGSWGDEAIRALLRVTREAPADPNSHGSVAVLVRGPANARMLAMLWYNGVRTLDEYTQTVAPAADLLASRLAYDASRPGLNKLRYNKYNFNLFTAFGVQYVLSPSRMLQPELVFIGAFPDATGQEAYLYRIGSYVGPLTPNKAVEVETLNGVIDALRDERTNLNEIVFVADAIQQPIVSAEKASFSYASHVLSFDVRSPGHSITVLPVLFSHCWQVPADSGVTLVRANGAFLGVVTPGSMSVSIEFVMSMWRPGCRSLDMRDWRADIQSLTPDKKLNFSSPEADTERNWSERLAEMFKKFSW